MKRVLLQFAVLLFVAATAGAASPKTYQVTGPVIELRDDVIVVQKGEEKWEIARDRDINVTGELKVGATVTIRYRMKATGIVLEPEAKKTK